MKKLFYSILVVLSTWSCNSWLDVQPYDQVAESVAFSSFSGFENALNGIYIELNSTSLYGQYLSCEMIELMAQRYNANSSTAYYYDLQQYSYTESSCKNRFASIWSKAYNLIANTNLLLKNCEEYNSVLSEEYYKLIKGEAYALRALLHFDIFRLWGPSYVIRESDNVLLPYYKQFTLDERPYCSPEDFMKNVVEDLKMAVSLLENDPVRTEGGRNEGIYTFTSWRNLRLNYYAVQLLLARAELYRGEKEAALRAAREVIDVQEQWFPWIKRESISSGRDDADRVFYSEILFGLQNSSVSTLYSGFFNGNNLSSEALLAPLSEQIYKIFNNNWDDYRYEAYLKTSEIINGASYNFFEKYKETTDTVAGTIIPMLRVSEAYYIAAECEIEATDGVKWLNRVLSHRGVQEISANQLATTLEQEYIREFFGEGQLFFYYKRLNKSAIPAANDPTYSRMIDMTNKYRIPIPEDETKYN